MSKKNRTRLDSFRGSQTVEAVEPRILMSRTVVPVTGTASKLWLSSPIGLVRHDVSPDSGGSNVPYGTTPAQMRSAYKASSTTFGTTTADGTGETIAIIDEYDDPNAASDLAAFDSYFGLSAPASFEKLNQSGQTSPLPSTDPGGPNSADGTWEEEESLDIEWSHVMAPKASIILYEASTNIYTAIAAADANPAVTVVSMSFGGGQFSGETSQNGQYFAQPGVTYLASTGDDGTPAGEPSSLANVVAVGGTTLNQSSGTYSSESGWSGSGGGVDSYDPQPGYQSFTVKAKSTTLRTTPDVSIEADPNTGVPIYDSWDFGSSTPWVPGYEGGTSLASPMWAGLIAVADQGRSLESLSSMSGISSTLPRLYQLPSSAYHDITSGNNGLAAGVGYDLVTGIGSPIANVLVPDLAGAATVTGRVYIDNLSNATFDGADTGIAGQTVYLDLNNDGVLDNNEPIATTNSSGVYTFTDEPAGGTVRLSTPTISGYIATSSSSTSITYGATDTVNFAYFPTAFATSTAATNYTLQLDSTGSYEQILINGTLTYSVPKSVLGNTVVGFNLTGTGDSLIVNGTNGNPVSSTGISYNGASGNADSLTVTGTASGNDTFVVSTSSFTFNGSPITLSNVSSLNLNPGTGLDTLTVNSGALAITPQTAGGGILTRNFANITVATSGSLTLTAPDVHADRMLVETASLSLSGSLNLTANDMIVHNGSVSGLSTLLATGYHLGTWNGSGISSTTAAAAATHLTALGIAPSTQYTGTFDNITPAAGDVLIKYTYYGDANLSGIVDGSDYTKIDNGFNNQFTGWYNGDFNYDGKIDGSDYTLIDNAFDTQRASLASQIASAPAVISQTAQTAAAVFSSQPLVASSPIVDDSPDKRRKAIDGIGL